VVNWSERRAERRATTPAERLALAEKRLAKTLERRGPESWRTVNAMEAVAKYREADDRYGDALALRKQVVTGRRSELGPEHQLTLAAEARLAVTYIELKRPDRAKPLLVHVRRGLTAAQGADDATVLAVTERLADVELALGEYEAAGTLLRDLMARYAERGDEVAGSAVGITLAKSLIRQGRYPEASELLRTVVEARGRVLGTDDPETLASLRNLASSLVWSQEFAEASIVARNLLAATVRTQGPDHADTLDAERLVEDIDRRLDAW
jgi:tetratricopeptide (TPR) repeat protein